ncbi:glycosyltransferase family 39 protein [Yeosuana marina]|uniref:ArnT family glycosyltransferase n=1 Tax=Yeosuana marina TaxID=1565536 RepID=UPI0030C87769
MTDKKLITFSKYIAVSVIIILVFRFILLGAIPLLDKTESRYAEIARLMYETKEWVVLQIDYGVPFWAKPPLSTWLSAISFSAYGVNEISARLPFYLLNITILIMLGYWIKRLKISFFLPAFILLTMPEFLIHTGVVSTDVALTFSVTLLMLSFWKAIQTNDHTIWDYLFFIAVGLGLISKGPIILVLTGPPILIWLLLQKIKIKDLYSRLPWIKGIILTCLISIPWYILAEKKSPGFLNYFIVGEHFNRFLKPEWNGDLYGSGHSQPLGMIWVFLFLFTFPWFQIVLIKLWKNRTTILKDNWVSFLVLWLFWIPFFFTMSKNILHTYILPVTIPIALLMVHWWPQYKNKKTALILSSFFPAAAIIIFIGLNFNKDWYKQQLNSDKYLIQNHINKPTEGSTPIYYWHNVSYSGEFYSKGHAKEITTTSELETLMNSDNKFYFIILKKRLKEIPKTIKNQLVLLDSNRTTSIFLHKKSQ